MFYMSFFTSHFGFLKLISLLINMNELMDLTDWRSFNNCDLPKQLRRVKTYLCHLSLSIIINNFVVVLALNLALIFTEKRGNNAIF